MGAVRRVPAPTRDVYVVRKMDGDRVFDSFGQDTNTFSDCFIGVEDLPREMIGGAQVVVMGTLGLAYPQTGAAMREAMAICKTTDTLALVDVNWRPVFWNNPEAAKKDILPFTLEADIVKITDDEAEWLFDIDRKSALKNPSLVRSSCTAVYYTCMRVAHDKLHSGLPKCNCKHPSQSSFRCHNTA